jgi:hypothetical protein
MLKKIVLTIDVPDNFDGLDESELDIAISDKLAELDYELINSDEYIDVKLGI